MADNKHICREAVLHICEAPFAYEINTTTLHVRLRTKRGNIKKVNVVYIDPYDVTSMKRAETEGPTEEPMKSRGEDNLFAWWGIEIHCPEKRQLYAFHLFAEEEDLYYGEDAPFAGTPGEANYFHYPTLYEHCAFSPPHWCKETVWYQLLPDRFCNGDASINPKDMKEWGTEPSFDSHYGGDLRGIINKLEYLSDLGISGLYITPIFKAKGPVKYDTIDYTEIDPQFGTKEDLKEMVQKCHKHGIKVMLDCVFNHSGELFEPFQDLLKNGEKSKYKNWFFVRSYPMKQDPPTYDTFSFIGSMPKFNTSDPECRKYLIDAATYWVREFDIDGWRLDVANELDHGFCKALRTAVKEAKKDCFILGEVWHNSMPWLRGDEFDSSMNYPLSFAIEHVLSKKISPTTFQQRTVSLWQRYQDSVNQTLFNLTGSHDTARAITRLGEDRSLAMMMYVLAFTFPGTPCIYYGDEIGMKGEFDPGCRWCFEWDENKHDKEFKDVLKHLIYLRKNMKALVDGDFFWVDVHDDQGRVVFQRATKNEAIITLVNVHSEKGFTVPIVECDATENLDTDYRTHVEGGQPQPVSVPKGRKLFDVTANEAHELDTNAQIEMGPHTFRILHLK